MSGRNQNASKTRSLGIDEFGSAASFALSFTLAGCPNILDFGSDSDSIHFDWLVLDIPGMFFLRLGLLGPLGVGWTSRSSHVVPAGNHGSLLHTGRFAGHIRFCH